MDIRLAERGDVPSLARLLWMHAAPEQQSEQPVEAFAVDLDAWWAHHSSTHLAYLAGQPRQQAVGMAWLALIPRVPRPGTITRLSADIQSVFVVPEHRGQGLGSALVRAATDYALRRGAAHVSVHSGRRAVPVYERLGFASSPQLLQVISPD